MADDKKRTVADLITWFESLVNSVENIAIELEASNMPRGYADRRDELRHRVAGGLFRDWMAWLFAQQCGILPSDGIAINAAAAAWRLADMLADLDPESPERQMGRSTITTTVELPAGD